MAASTVRKRQKRLATLGACLNPTVQRWKPFKAFKRALPPADETGTSRELRDALYTLFVVPRRVLIDVLHGMWQT